MIRSVSINMETVKFLKIMFGLYFVLFSFWYMITSLLHTEHYTDYPSHLEILKHDQCYPSDIRKQLRFPGSVKSHANITYLHMDRGDLGIIGQPPRVTSYKVTIVASAIYEWNCKFPKQCDCHGDQYHVTNDTSTAHEADVVLFSTGARISMTLEEWRQFYKERNPSQLWILASRESPQSCTAVKPPDDMVETYNLSSTYHSRSNFPTPYGWFVKFDSPKNDSINWYSEKSKLIQWSSSHCSLGKTRYTRMEFVHALKKYLNITMYGECGDGKFFGDDYVEAVRLHKFALVLENSCCSEYITEKLWNALTIYYNVPVVYGATREEYERIAPPSSFIFVQDFSSLQELADYIIEVGSDEMKYNQYHDWRRLGYGEKQNLHEDRIYHCHSICRMSQTIKEAQRGKIFQFDESGEVFFGGCRKCQDEINVLLLKNEKRKQDLSKTNSSSES